MRYFTLLTNIFAKMDYNEGLTNMPAFVRDKKLYVNTRTYITHIQFRTPFREAKFCGVPSCSVHKLGCATGKERN